MPTEIHAPLFKGGGAGGWSSSASSLLRRTHGEYSECPPCIHCINCGVAGHVYRHCKEPVTSYGIICFRRKDASLPLATDNAQVLLVQRRDTFAYVEFMRGQYNPSDTAYVDTLLAAMTDKERHQLLHNCFESNWEALWGRRKHNTASFVRDYQDSGRRFERVREHVRRALGGDPPLPRSEHASRLSVGFPKGKRTKDETDRGCAVREFYEETGVALRDINLHDTLPVVEETFVGTNSVRYRYRYYVANLSDRKRDVELDISLAVMEVSKAEWVDIADAAQAFRAEKQDKRVDVLERAFRMAEGVWVYD